MDRAPLKPARRAEADQDQGIIRKEDASVRRHVLAIDRPVDEEFLRAIIETYKTSLSSDEKTRDAYGREVERVEGNPVITIPGDKEKGRLFLEGDRNGRSSVDRATKLGSLLGKEARWNMAKGPKTSYGDHDHDRMIIHSHSGTLPTDYFTKNGFRPFEKPVAVIEMEPLKKDVTYLNKNGHAWATLSNAGETKTFERNLHYGLANELIDNDENTLPTVEYEGRWQRGMPAHHRCHMNPRGFVIEPGVDGCKVTVYFSKSSIYCGTGGGARTGGGF
ncbi:MAG: hypothetical protein AAB383_06140 [Patescibacteria group bacterium]